MNDANWDDLRVLLAVVDARSVSAGAKKLGLSQPTAGRRIAALEETLGVRLLVRRNNGIVPTPAGETVLTEARRMADGADSITRKIKGSSQDRTVRIALTEGLATRWLPSLLHAHRRELEGIRVELVVDSSAANLAAREADVAIRLFRPTEPDLVTRKVSTLSFGFFAAPSYVKRNGVPRRLKDLTKHQHVGAAVRNVATAPVHVKWLENLVPRECFVARTNSLATLAELTRTGLGLGLLTQELFGNDADFIRVLPSVETPRLDVWLTTHADLRRDSAASRLVELLTHWFQTRANLAE